MGDFAKIIYLFAALAAILSSGTEASPAGAKGSSGPDYQQPASSLSCAAVRPIFQMKNISDTIPEEPVSGLGLTVCEASGKSCCTPQMERGLLSLVAHDFDSVLHHHSRSLQGLLADAASRIQDHVIELTRQSENKTQALLAALYERMSGPARPTVALLFDDLRRFLLEPEDDEFEEESDGEASKDGEGPKKNSRSEFIIPATSPDEAVSHFFTELFPLVYRHALNSHLRPGDHFTGDFDACLRATKSEVLPFGDSPRRAATSVGRALGATRVLLRSLRMGSAAVATASRRLQRSGRSSPCDAALLRMTYCARCRGIPPTLRPCAGLCLNALRGCLTPLAELELPWAAYVESAERLVAAMVGDPPTAPAQVYTSDSTSPSSRHGVARILASVDSWISEAIMYALENGPTLEKKVKRACGQARWSTAQSVDDDVLPAAQGSEDEVSKRKGKKAHGWEKEEEEVKPREQGAVEGVVGRVAEDTMVEEKLDTALRRFLSGLLRSRGFYGTLAETLCSDEGFAETGESAACWNGQRVGEYTKTVVASSLSAQKYNPEVSWTALHRTQDPEIARLSDKLRHVRQVLLSQLSSSPESASLVLEGHGGAGGSGGQEEQEEGSGSGHRPVTQWDEDDEDNGQWPPDEGSGSGDGDSKPTFEKPSSGKDGKEVGSNITTGGAANCSTMPLFITLMAALLLVLPRYALSATK